ncbi:hypothetical protein BELL_1023g00070 [Botrytis elliptica]|uniref:Uncharacterized protein n=1 Tax=Botrytis elliptica TaxID=278938 RepID=A0A4Z1IZZ2_9HELO|nr:hypothetical protein BELL_1023g00070 [Botrytis elliptica]
MHGQQHSISAEMDTGKPQRTLNDCTGYMYHDSMPGYWCDGPKRREYGALNEDKSEDAQNFDTV